MQHFMGFFFEFNSNLLMKRLFMLLKAAFTTEMLNFDLDLQFATLLIKIPRQKMYLSLN